MTSAIIKCLGNMTSIPSGSETLQETTVAFALIANAHLELNQRRRDMMKPDLHSDYKHLCSSNSSVTITDQLFGDDLAKEVKELTKSTALARKLPQIMGQHRDHAMTPETQDTSATMTTRDVDTETGGPF